MLAAKPKVGSSTPKTHIVKKRTNSTPTDCPPTTPYSPGRYAQSSPQEELVWAHLVVSFMYVSIKGYHVFFPADLETQPFATSTYLAQKVLWKPERYYGSQKRLPRRRNAKNRKVTFKRELFLNV